MAHKHTITILNTREDINRLPTTTGVYQYRDKDKTILYIGKSVNLKARILSHRENAKTDAKEAGFAHNATYITCIITDSEFKALLLESQLISTYKPKYNVRWRDDKSYLYIKMTKKDTYPKISLTRREHHPNATYFGPFSSVRTAEQILRQIRKIIPFCMQKRIFKRACFYSKIGLCDPCPSYIEHLEDEEKKAALRKKYRTNMRLISNVLEGKTDVVLKHLYAEVKKYSSHEQYEKAIEIRDSIIRLEQLVTRKRLEPDTLSAYNISEKSIAALQRLLQRYMPISSLSRIECYDVSNQGSEHVTASMVVFTDGLVDKKEYRKFKIKNTALQSDFERMEEVLTRRFTHTSWPLPDLVVIDGGKPQLRFVQRVFARDSIHVPFIGIAKHPDRLIMGTDGFPLIRPPLNHPGFNLIRAIRDESHRFAKKYSTFLKNELFL